MGITEGARPQGRGERMRSRRDWREQLCTVQEALTEDERTEGEGGMAGDGGCRWEPKDIPTKAWGPDEAADEVTSSHPGVPRRWGMNARPRDKGLKEGVEGLADTGSHGV